MYKYTSLFRLPREVQKLRDFLLDQPLKEHILEEFTTGFVSHFDY